MRPISAEAKLQLSLKAGKDPNIPQALVGVVLDEVAVALEKEQVCEMYTSSLPIRVYAIGGHLGACIALCMCGVCTVCVREGERV